MPTEYYDPLGLKFPSNHPHCKAIKKKIDNLNKQLDKRWEDIKNNPGKLPQRQTPLNPLKGPFEQDVRGHMTIINMMDRERTAWERQYDKDCDDDEDGGSNGSGAAVCALVVLVAIGLVLAPEITVSALIIGGATQ